MAAPDPAPTLMSLPLEIKNHIYLLSGASHRCCIMRPRLRVPMSYHPDNEAARQIDLPPFPNMARCIAVHRATSQSVQPVCKQYYVEATAVVPAHGFMFCHTSCFLQFASPLKRLHGPAKMLRVQQLDKVRLNLKAFGENILEPKDGDSLPGLQDIFCHWAQNVARELEWDWTETEWKREGTWLLVWQKAVRE